MRELQWRRARPGGGGRGQSNQQQDIQFVLLLDGLALDPTGGHFDKEM